MDAWEDEFTVEATKNSQIIPKAWKYRNLFSNIYGVYFTKFPRNQRREKRGRSVKGPMSRTFVMCALAQRRIIMETKKFVTKLHRGSSKLERSMKHSI